MTDDGHEGLRLAGSAHDLDRADAVGGQKHDLGAPDMLLRGVAIPDQRRQTARSVGEMVKKIPVRMPQTRVHMPEKGVPNGTVMLGGNR